MLQCSHIESQVTVEEGGSVWCFFDESYHDGDNPVTTVAACLMRDDTVRGLDLVLYEARREHFGLAHARDLTLELKGSRLFSKNSFSQMEKFGNNRNLALAEQVLERCNEFQDEHPIWIFGAVVYGTVGVLNRLNSSRLEKPVADILDKVSVAATEADSDRRVDLVFDSQICGAEPDIAAAVRRFVAGVKLKNVSHYPLVGVSHVSPGIQFADICAFILRRRAMGATHFIPWVERIEKLEWSGTVNGFQRSGIRRWHQDDKGRLVVCHEWK